MLVSAASVIMTMSVQATLPAMPVLQRHFDLSDADVGWFTTVYIIPTVLLTIPLGTRLAKYSRRATFGGALALYGVAGALQGFSPDYEMLLVLRAVQGLSFAVVMPLTVVILSESYSAAARTRAFSTRQTSVTVGEFVMPLLGTLLALASWRAPFLGQLLALVVAAGAFFVLDGERRDQKSASNKTGLWSVARNTLGGRPILLISFSRFLFKFALLGYLPILLVQRGDIGIAEAGVVVSVSAGAAGITASQLPRLLRHIRGSVLTSTATMLIGASLLAFVVVDKWLVMLALAVAFGIGDGIIAVMQDLYLASAWVREQHAAIASISQTARNLGKLVAPVVMTIGILAVSLAGAFALLGVVALVMIPVFASLRHLDHHFRPT